MDKHLLVRLTIPVVAGDRSRQGESLIFHHWLPIQGDDALIVTEGGMDLHFWLDKQCLHHAIEVDLDGIDRYVNINVGKINVDLSGIDVSDEIADLIEKFAVEKDWTPEHINSTYPHYLVEEYHVIAENIYLAVVKQFNRLIAYVRAFKGQYWLQEYTSDPKNIHSEFLRLRAKVKVGESDWLRFTAAGIGHLTANMPSEQRFITQEDWQSISNHMVGERKAPLVGQLLATADEFRELEHRRAALIEAISSLEIAVSQFAEQANPESWSTLLAGRTTAGQFKNHVKHLGLTCTLGYLFPVIFSEDQVPANIIKTCQKAISERNTVIHKGQRDVDKNKLGEYLHSIRDLCERLQRLMDDQNYHG